MVSGRANKGLEEGVMTQAVPGRVLHEERGQYTLETVSDQVFREGVAS